jgi:phage baseplate assembly protein W
MTTYSGFSTYRRVRKYRVTDFDLVKQDLYNHFHIRKGQKLMNPNFGTIIWDLLYEPFTESVREAIEKDIRTIVAYDPRIEAEKITITEFVNGIMVELDIVYRLTNESSALALKFERDAALRAAGE